MNGGNPPPSSEAARNRMKAVRRKGTKAELELRAALIELGLDFEINRPPCPGLRREADILFPQERIAVFVDGCFWHGCPIHGTMAKANAQFWKEKIERNKRRDADTNQRLREKGWCVVRVWEHVPPKIAAERIRDIVMKRRERKTDVSLVVIE